MKKFLLIGLLVASMQVIAQDSSYNYVKGTGSFKLIAGDTLRFETYVKKASIKQRKVLTRSTRYLFELKKNKQGKVQEIKDDQGNLLGTVLFAGNHKFDLILVSGDRYSWKKIDGRSWSYQKEGKVVLTGSYQKEGNTKKLAHSLHAEDVPELLILSSYERGSEIIISKASTGPMVLGAVAVALVSQAVK
jgi:hypothetical protein